MDTSSYCVKTDGRCSAVRCNICPRYVYEPTGASVIQPYPLNAPQPRCNQEAYEFEQQKELFEVMTAPFSGETSNIEPDVEDASERKCDAVVKPSHYTQWQIEPIQFIMRNAMPFWMGNVVKYCMRADAKNGVEDLRKAQRYIEFRIRQLEGEVDITS